MPSSFQFDASDTLRRLDALQQRVKSAIDVYGRIKASEMKSWAKANATWTDRTGHSRQSIDSDASWVNETTYEIRLTGGTEYFIFLEFAHDRRFAILKPTIERFENQFLQGLRDMLK